MEHLLGLASECRWRYKTFVGTLHCTLENGADLCVNEHQKIRHYRARSIEEECQIEIFYFARCVRKLVLYSDVIHSFDWKSAVEHDGAV